MSTTETRLPHRRQASPLLCCSLPPAASWEPPFSHAAAIYLPLQAPPRFGEFPHRPKLPPSPRAHHTHSVPTWYSLYIHSLIYTHAHAPTTSLKPGRHVWTSYILIANMHTDYRNSSLPCHTIHPPFPSPQAPDFDDIPFHLKSSHRHSDPNCSTASAPPPWHPHACR